MEVEVEGVVAHLLHGYELHVLVVKLLSAEGLLGLGQQLLAVEAGERPDVILGQENAQVVNHDLVILNHDCFDRLLGRLDSVESPS